MLSESTDSRSEQDPIENTEPPINVSPLHTKADRALVGVREKQGLSNVVLGSRRKTARDLEVAAQGSRLQALKHLGFNEARRSVNAKLRDKKESPRQKDPHLQYTKKKAETSASKVSSPVKHDCLSDLHGLRRRLGQKSSAVAFFHDADQEASATLCLRKKEVDNAEEFQRSYYKSEHSQFLDRLQKRADYSHRVLEEKMEIQNLLSEHSFVKFQIADLKARCSLLEERLHFAFTLRDFLLLIVANYMQDEAKTYFPGLIERAQTDFAYLEIMHLPEEWKHELSIEDADMQEQQACVNNLMTIFHTKTIIRESMEELEIDCLKLLENMQEGIELNNLKLSQGQDLADRLHAEELAQQELHNISTVPVLERHVDSNGADTPIDHTSDEWNIGFDKILRQSIQRHYNPAAKFRKTLQFLQQQITKIYEKGLQGTSANVEPTPVEQLRFMELAIACFIVQLRQYSDKQMAHAKKVTTEESAAIARAQKQLKAKAEAQSRLQRILQEAAEPPRGRLGRPVMSRAPRPSIT